MAKTILLVDDDPVTIEMLKGNLNRHGYRIEVAYNGEEGLQKAQALLPDLVILDIQMPKMDGYTFILEFKKKLDIQAIPVFVLTTKDTMQDIFQIEGVKEYFIKPFRQDELLAKIREYLPAA